MPLMRHIGQPPPTDMASMNNETPFSGRHRYRFLGACALDKVWLASPLTPCKMTARARVFLVAALVLAATTGCRNYKFSGYKRVSDLESTLLRPVGKAEHIETTGPYHFDGNNRVRGGEFTIDVDSTRANYIGERGSASRVKWSFYTFEGKARMKYASEPVAHETTAGLILAEDGQTYFMWRAPENQSQWIWAPLDQRPTLTGPITSVSPSLQ